jgi:GNAT superfamily N-acetyltransferase/adenylate kinase family enzyme
MEQVKVRDAQEADWIALEVIFHTNRADGTEWLDSDRPKDGLREQSEGEKILVAVIRNKVVGFVAIWEPESFIHHLYVDKIHQGKGIGKKLVWEAQKRSPGPLRLKCVEKNKRALEFYFGSGWREVGRGDSNEGMYRLLEYNHYPERLRIRLYRESDGDRLVRIFRDAIRALGPEQYDARQVAAWAAAADDPPTFHKRLARGFTVVAEQDGNAVGFAQLFPPDVVEMIYCDPGHAHGGIGGQLLVALEHRASSLGQVILDTKASLLARPFFEKHGYQALGREVVTREGVAIPRFPMRKLLPDPPPSRWAIIGNAGSGKTTLARKIAQLTGASVLDLDTLAWAANTPTPERRAVAETRRLLDSFGAEHETWIAEGCYEDLVAELLRFDPCLVWLRAGVGACLSHCRSREFEPHKFASLAEQNAALPALLEWVAGYPDREGPMSEAAHRALFETYQGRKREVVPEGNPTASFSPTQQAPTHESTTNTHHPPT